MTPAALLAALWGAPVQDWSAAARAAGRHGFGPRLALRTDVPAEIGQALARQRAGVLAENLARVKALRAACEALGAPPEVPVVLLKGAAYLTDLVDDPSIRPMSDVDVLVRREDRSRAVERLVTLGYIPSWPAGRASRDREHHELVLAHPQGALDLHQAFVQRARTRIDYEAVWARRRPAPGWPAHVALLAQEDAFVHACLHQAVHEYDLPLAGFVDLALMVERWRLDPARVRARAEEWGARRALWCSMQLLAALHPPAAPFAGEAAPRLSPPLCALLDRLVVRRVLAADAAAPPRRRPRLAQLLDKAALMEPAARARFLVAHARALLAPRAGPTARSR